MTSEFEEKMLKENLEKIFEEHISKENEMNELQCNICYRTFDHDWEAGEHIQNAHGDLIRRADFDAGEKLARDECEKEIQQLEDNLELVKRYPSLLLDENNIKKDERQKTISEIYYEAQIREGHGGNLKDFIIWLQSHFKENIGKVKVEKGK